MKKYIGIRRRRNAGRLVWVVSFSHKSIRYEFGQYKNEIECAKAYDLFVIKKGLDRKTNFLKKI